MISRANPSTTLLVYERRAYHDDDVHDGDRACHRRLSHSHVWRRGGLSLWLSNIKRVSPSSSIKTSRKKLELTMVFRLLTIYEVEL